MIHAFALRALAALAALLALNGCATLSAISDATTPLDVYELRAPATIPQVEGRTLPRDVIIELPTTSGALQTDRIMIRPNALQAQYLPNVRWSEPTPVMMQTLMLRSIEATNGLRYVARQPLAASGDFALITELTDFQAELAQSGDTATIRVRFVSRLVREQNASIVASRGFSSSAVSTSLETQDLVRAFDVAVAGVMPNFASWLITVLRNR